MTTIATLMVRITADTTDYQTKLKAVSEMGNKMTTVGNKLSKAVTLPLVSLGTYTVYAASNLNESMSKVQVVFGKTAKSVQDFAKTADKNLGLSQRAALEAAGTFGNLFTTMGLGQDDAAGMSTELVKLAADLASFNNLNTDEVLLKLRSGLVGETEPLRSLGVNLTAAGVQAKAMEMGLADASGQVSQSAMVQARYALILEQTTNAQGDFARTSGGLANQLRIAKASIENAAATLGAKLIPFAVKAVGFVTNLVTAFSKLPAPIQDSVLTIAAIAAAAGPVLTIFGNLIKLGAGVAGFFQKLPALISAVTTVMKANLAVIIPWAAAIGALIAVWGAYNDLQKRTAEGVKQVQTAWGNFFNNQIQQGKSAAEIATAYSQKTAEASQILNGQKDIIGKAATAWIKLTTDEKKFLEDQAGLQQALMLTSKSAEDYWQAFILARGGTIQMANSSNLLFKAFREQARAQWEATNGIPPLIDEEGKLTAVGTLLTDSMKNVASVISSLDLPAGAAEKKITDLQIAMNMLTPAQAQINSDTQLMAKGFGMNEVSLDRMTLFLKSATAGTSDLTDAERKQLTALTAVEKKLKEIVSLSDTYGMLTQAATDLGMADEELTNLQLIMQESVGGLKDELNTTTTDMQLLAQATALGIYSTTQYGLAMHDAAAGTFELSNAERASIQASVDAAQAQRDKALAVQSAGQAYLDLATSLKGATNAQIAQTAIQGLGTMLEEKKIDFSTYFGAVSGVQEAFGLSDAKSRALASAIPLLNDALASGILPTDNYAKALKAVIKDSSDGVVNMDAIINKFGAMPESAAAAIGAFDTFDQKLAIVPQTAATSATQTYNAFTTPNWAGAGLEAGQKIAQGITTSTPFITAAAQAAVQAAINAATAAGATGPKPPTTPTSTGGPPPGSGGGYAEGGAGIVPSGYPNDSYLVGLTSGETFTVTPPGGSPESGVSITQNFYGNAEPEQVKTAARDGVLAAQRAKGVR